ncbi:hypothetical protein [Aeropyrum camini]|uniref:C2H2-type domain-containing protein n=1 Tax=Aeropyrum camini SY1 = JCM 12091 TaxID=1198449 RepID=U3TBF8_9CREN|nr:hypothetical protein [Aeropyrum camini]BAN90877.1 hypothetical protein ACAM_1408 [Aeropyrum camini SY1 = JCM 12091]
MAGSSIAARVARMAAFGEGLEEGDLSPHLAYAAAQVADLLKWETGVCPFCGRRLQSRRGYYIHLVRVHSGDIARLVDRVAERGASRRGL